ncbi:Plasma-membrane choline transporter family protein [Zea mays]|uniref:Plasma-membrane choline transporter family protein n=1 Tax=Zea mays TaxID=4577 RepID=A0A1D6KZC2_MAIZE|nr:Plasma-membrane choline transporter family protein [Zea mays]
MAMHFGEITTAFPGGGGIAGASTARTTPAASPYQCRMMIAWPQACVAAYHVAYAENPQNPQLGTLIPEHLRELQAMAADQDRPRVIHFSDDIDNS